MPFNLKTKRGILQLSGYHQGVGKILLLQALVSLVVAALLCFYRASFAAGFLCGAVAMFLGNAFSWLCLFHQYRTSSPTHTLIKFFLGKFGQFVILISAFLLYATRGSLPLLAFLVGVLVSQAVFWLAPFWIKDRAKRYG